MEKVCVVVGAGPGIGLAVAHRFAKEGFRPVLISRRPDNLQELAAHLHAEGIDVFTLGADAAEPGAMEWAFQEIREKVGPVDVLIYNAAAGTPGPPTLLDPEEMVANFRVGVVGALACVQQVAAPMRTAGQGTIILTGGGFAIQPMASMASLGVSKAAIRNLAHSLAEELGPSGIHVATVTVMGMVKPGTPFDPNQIAEVYWQLHQQPRESWKAEIQFTGS